jgi:isopenicillin-N epimerase
MLLDPGVINLNTGSFGPLPRPVFERVTALRQRLAEAPMDFLLRQMPPLLWEARERLAQFVGAKPERLVFTANVTAAVNMVASALQLATPGEILLTDHEYGAMHWCWERAAQRQGLTLRIVCLPILPPSPKEIVDAVAGAMSEHTRLLFFSHLLSPTGMVLPAQDLCALARRRGVLTVVDGAHAPAMVPLALDQLGCDFYGANCHKWLLGPTGCGFLYLGHGSENRLQPLQVSWGWQQGAGRLDERDEFGSTPRLRFLEFEGTRDICPWLAVPSALDFQSAIGWEQIRERNAELAGHVQRRLGKLPGLTLHTPTHRELRGFMTAFRLPPGVDPPTLRKQLWQEYRIEAPIIERPVGILTQVNTHSAPPTHVGPHCLIRVSTHFYNTHEEIDRLAQALKELLKT